MSEPSLASVWSLPEGPTHPPLTGTEEVDVAVVGAGIAGLTTAALLAEAGASVCVLEARQLGTGTTGRTTAKASALQGVRYAQLAQLHGPEVAQRYARSQLDALDWLRDRVAARGVACDWRELPNQVHATTIEGRATLEQELEAARSAGLDVAWRDDAGLPFATTGAIELAAQAGFDPGPHLADLAAQVAATPGCHVHEGSRVAGIVGRRHHEVRTAGGGRVRAAHVVVATLLPIVDRGLFFARAEPKSSYLVALRAEGPPLDRMSISADAPTRSLRPAADEGGEVVIVGGGGHDTGRGAPTEARYERLESWARAHLPVGDVVARWSAHDPVPADHLPWVGPSSRLTPNVLVATGFEKWGMTAGTAAALALADRILDRPEGPSAAWAPIFRTDRLAPGGLRTVAELNATVAGRLAADWARPERGTEVGRPGRRRRRGLAPVGSPDAGSGREVSVVCTHLGGVCEWNDGDRTWDCPLHGSRFEADGEVLAGPATRPLREVPVAEPGSSDQPG